MYAVSFDMVCKDLQTHLGEASKGYRLIRALMEDHGFTWQQGSLYVLDSEDMAQLMTTIHDLASKSWFSASVRDIRAFRVEQWSDFTPFVKSLNPSGSGAAGSQP